MIERSVYRRSGTDVISANQSWIINNHLTILINVVYLSTLPGSFYYTRPILSLSFLMLFSVLYTPFSSTFPQLGQSTRTYQLDRAIIMVDSLSLYLHIANKPTTLILPPFLLFLSPNLLLISNRPPNHRIPPLHTKPTLRLILPQINRQLVTPPR